MAILKDLIVHGPSHFIGKVFINDSHIAKINGSDVPENPKFTDTVSSMSTTGTGNAITGVSVSNGNFTFTKGSTFLTSQNTAALYAGTSAATTNVVAANTSAHLILKDGSTYNRIKIQGTAEIEVTASSNGILSVGVPAQSPNTFYAGPVSGTASSTPNFRNIGLADLPVVSAITSTEINATSQKVATVSAISEYVEQTSIEYIVGSNVATSTSAAWVGSSKEKGPLRTGKTIAYKLSHTPSGNATLKLSFSDGTASNAYPVYSMTTRVTGHYPKNSIIFMTFDGSYWRTAGWYNTSYLNRTNTTTITSFLPILIGNATGTATKTSSGHKDAEHFAYQPSTQTLKVGQVSASKYTGTGVSTGEIPDQPTDDTLPTSLAVQTAIDNIQIGGRNYLRNTRFFTGWMIYRNITGSASIVQEQDESAGYIVEEPIEDENGEIEESTTQEIETNTEGEVSGLTVSDDIIVDNALGILYFPTPVSSNSNFQLEARPNYNIDYNYVRQKTITISADVKVDSLNPISVLFSLFVTNTERGDRIKYREVYLTPTGENSSPFTPSAKGIWQKVFATVTLTDGTFFTSSVNGESLTSYQNCYFGARIARKGGNNKPFYIRRPKIELGNKVTDWIPAVEDNEIDLSEINTKENLFPSKLSSQFILTNGVLQEKVSDSFVLAWCNVESHKKYTISRQNNQTGYVIYALPQEPKAGLSVGQPLLQLQKGSQIYKDTISIPSGKNYLLIIIDPGKSTKKADYNLKIQQGSNATRWSHYSADLIATPQMFGAMADGTHDDTEAIQKALDTANNIFFPNGIYMISYPLIARSNCHIYGNGPLSRIKAKTNFSKENMPHNTTANPNNVGWKQHAKWAFISSPNHMGTSTEFMLYYLESWQGKAFGFTNDTTSSLILENLQFDCNCRKVSSGGTNLMVGGIRILSSYNNGVIKNINVTNVKQLAIYVGDENTYSDIRNFYNTASDRPSDPNDINFYKTRFYNYWRYNDKAKAVSSSQAAWYKATRTQSLLVDQCLFQNNNIPYPSYSGPVALSSVLKDLNQSQYKVTNPLGRFYNSLELNLSNSKFLLQSRSIASVTSASETKTRNFYHNVPCLYIGYSADAFIRGCSFTNGHYGIHLDKACRYFRLIGNTYERIPTAAQATAQISASTNQAQITQGCYLVKVSGESGRSAIRGIIMEVPYAEINSSIRLENAQKIQVIGGITELSQGTNTSNNTLNSWLTAW